MPKLGFDLSDRGWTVAALLAAAIWPIADLLMANAGAGVNLAGPDALRWFALILSIEAIGAVVLRFMLGTWLRAAAVSAVLIVLFFSYPVAEPGLRRIQRLAHQEHGAAMLYSVIWVGAALVMTVVSRSRANQKFFCILVGVMGLTTSLGAVASATSADSKRESHSVLPARLRQRANVYEFIFDGMGRPDALKASLGIDVGWVNQVLEAREFTIARNAEATYLSTEPSIHSLLNPSDSDEYNKVDIGASEVVRYFRAQGYHYHHYGEVFAFSACSGFEDLCISTGRRGLNEVDVVMLRKTPIYAAFQRSILSATTSRNLGNNLQIVANAPVNDPTLTITYMVPPHPPFIFSADCHADQQDFNDFRAWRSSGIKRYETSYGCVVRALLPAIDTIIARDPSAIILISGDHGTKFRKAVASTDVGWTEAELAERRPLLLAARVPIECHAFFSQIRRLPEVYPTLTKCLARDGAFR